jgi:hypothetical protein
MGQFIVSRAEREERAIREYVEWQSRGEEVVAHAEKLKTERLRAERHDVWDVHTDRDRYWVITNPTNLYSQTLFPSADYTISFHIGLMQRVWGRRAPAVGEQQRKRLLAVWRRWSQAADALDAADEAEEFQAVGMRCRECLLTLVKAIGHGDGAGNGRATPKAGDFVGLVELIAETVAPGSSLKAIRGYLKVTARETWQLVSWLTHAANATRTDAEVAVEATQGVLTTFGSALLRHDRGALDRCPSCGSYRLNSDHRPGGNSGSADVTLCETCGWISDQPASGEAKA